MSIFARRCQECGHIQTDTRPITAGLMSNAYMERKCRKCGSRALDYGHSGYTMKEGKIVDLNSFTADPEDMEDDEEEGE